MDRGLAGMDENSHGVLGRARDRVEELLSGYERRAIDSGREQAMIEFAQREGSSAGLDGLPEILRPEYAREPGLI